MCLRIIHLLTNRCMMYCISHECTRPLLYLLEHNNKSNQIKGDQYERGRTIKFANSPPCACRGSTGQKP